MKREMSPKEFASVVEQTSHIIMAGYVKYVDVFEQKWISGFCFRWHPLDGGMYLTGGRKHNYARQDV